MTQQKRQREKYRVLVNEHPEKWEEWILTSIQNIENWILEIEPWEYPN